MAANPTIGGKLIRPHVERFGNGVATVRLTIPKTAHGKQLKVQLTIKLDGQTASRTTSLKIA
jgi:hypothetical protein